MQSACKLVTNTFVYRVRGRSELISHCSGVVLCLFFFFTFFWQLHKQAVLKYKYALCYSPFKGESNRNHGMWRARRERRRASSPLLPVLGAAVAALAGSSAPGRGVKTHPRASGGRYGGGKATAGGFGSSGGADSCPSCGARCRDGDGCGCSSWLSTLDATRLQPRPMLGTDPSDMGPIKVSAAHQYRRNSLWAWGIFGCFGYQQQQLPAQVMKQLVPS